ncbi:MAG: Substrate-specific component CbrT of predicted cobalamin ECF transporter, partial [uncultured Thermomicrobiales bacterium]
VCCVPVPAIHRPGRSDHPGRQPDRVGRLFLPVPPARRRPRRRPHRPRRRRPPALRRRRRVVLARHPRRPRRRPRPRHRQDGRPARRPRRHRRDAAPGTERARRLADLSADPARRHRVWPGGRVPDGRPDPAGLRLPDRRIGAVPALPDARRGLGRADRRLAPPPGEPPPPAVAAGRVRRPLGVPLRRPAQPVVLALHRARRRRRRRSRLAPRPLRRRNAAPLRQVLPGHVVRLRPLPRRRQRRPCPRPRRPRPPRPRPLPFALCLATVGGGNRPADERPL